MWLENENIRLRALEPEDIELLYVWENNTQLWKHGSTLTPYSRLSLRQYLTEAVQSDFFQQRQLRLIIEVKENEKSKVVGTLDLYEYDPHNKRVGVGILIDAPSQRKNYGLQSLLLIEEYAFYYLDIHQLYAYIAVDNEKSIHLFQKAGYTLSGTLKHWKKERMRYKDVYLMQLIRKDE